MLKASPEVKRLANLERKLKKENANPKEAIKNSIGVNEGGFTRFKHKPSNLIVTFRDDLKIIGEAPVVEFIKQKLEEVFGPLKLIRNSFTNCGLRHVQDLATKEVSWDQIEYVNAL